MTELVVEHDDKTTYLILNRPSKRNALSASLVELMLQELEKIDGRITRLVVLKGNGDCFCAGFDLGEIESQSDGDLLLRFVRIEQLLQALYYSPVDTVALAHGKNFGAGADIFCACSHRIATQDATFQMPGLSFNLVLGTRRLVERVGSTQARSILRGGKTLTADQAFGIGLVTQICANADWQGRVNEALAAASRLTDDANARLNRVSLRDTCDSDIADLARSAAAPRLKSRIMGYRASTKARQG